MIVASLAFYFMSTTFVTSQAYGAIVDEFGKKKANNAVIDPDFVNASKHYFEFFLKVFRPKMNIWGVDFFEPGKGFSRFCRLVNFLNGAILIMFPILHFTLIVFAASYTLGSELHWLLKSAILIAVVVINFTALVISLGAQIDFEFAERQESDDGGQESGVSEAISQDH